ncbi:hypothetical protein [Actinacidiphila rubida]|uniref:hypothetical protein n=1 Tax=Actinacidiphila rubida TaxID=310780 RepID=UPI000945D58A|nr:hypothetical protein [Actinacidiphila rubida]
MPEPGYHIVREHVRRNPRTSVAKKTSPWVVGAAVVTSLWIWGHLGGSSHGATPAHTSSPSVSAAVAAAHR